MISFLILFLFVSGCATSPRTRFFIGASAGASAGAVSGAALSPNNESRGLNALVFGLLGGFIGGLGALFIHDDAAVPESKPQAVINENTSKQIQILNTNKELPEFLKQRLKPVVIEEFREKDRIGEDGLLHESHNVYRIKQPAELISNPIVGEKK